jgi:hypothetical protein
MDDIECEQEGDGGVMWVCGAPAVGKWRGHWYCSEHLDEQMKESTYTPQPESETFL